MIQCVIDYNCDLEDTLLGRQLPRTGERLQDDRAEGQDASDGDRTTDDGRSTETDRTEAAEQEATRTSQVSA